MLKVAGLEETTPEKMGDLKVELNREFDNLRAKIEYFWSRANEFNQTNKNILAEFLRRECLALQVMNDKLIYLEEKLNRDIVEGADLISSEIAWEKDMRYDRTTDKSTSARKEESSSKKRLKPASKEDESAEGK